MVSRRNVLKAGVGVAAVAATGAVLKPEDIGKEHSPYFQQLSSLLKGQGVDKPSLIIDLDLLDENIKTLNKTLASQSPKTYRIVVKSLPSMELVNYIADKTSTNAFMVFHRPFLEALIKARPDADVLFGKPMPVSAAEHFYKNFDPQISAFIPEQQLQWLIDSQQRLVQYLALAKQTNQKIKVNFELDVGLHRGGFSDLEKFSESLKLIQDNPEYLVFGGLMGYDAHVSKFPGFLADREFESVKNIYQTFTSYLQNNYPGLAAESLCLNGAGSPTIARYADQDFINDISAGSCLLKTTSFDIDSLTDFAPCCYIASRILKKHPNTGLPTLEWLGDIESGWDPNKAENYFIYSGNWLAEPHSPVGMTLNSTYISSNQQGLQSSPSVNLTVDDFVFFRPVQSEAVLLQFGDLLMVRNQQPIQYWPVITG